MPQAIGIALLKIGFFAFELVAGAAAAATLGAGAAVAIGAAVVVGGTLIAKQAMSLFEVEMPTVDTDASRQRTVKSTTEPQKIIYGEALVSGPISFIGLSGTDNSDLYQTIVLAGHEVTEITDIHMDDVVISNADINGGAAAGGAVGSGSVEFGPKNGTICVINKYKGEASQTADPLFTAAFSTGPASNQYTSAHRGDGIAYLAMKWVLNEDSSETWEKFSPSNVKALVKGKPVYDPRLDTGAPNYNPLNQLFITYNATAGSYVGQGQNPALVLADYLISDLGMGISPSKIDWSSFITAANGCDVSVNVPNSGTEKRFTCNGVLFATDSHQKNINKILSSMNGNLVYSNGKYIVHAGIYEDETIQEPFETLNEDDLIGAISIKTSLERSDRFNTIKGLFIDPAQNHKSSEFPKVQLADAVARDNDEILEKEVQYPMTNSSYMAQRLSFKLIKLSDQQKIISFPANLSALRITAGDRVKVSIEELSWSDKIFQCVGWNFSEEGGVNLTLREDSESAYDDPVPNANPALSEYSTITATGDITDAFRGVPSPSGLRAASGEKKVFLNWVNPGKPSDFGTIEIYASASNNIANAVKIGETDGTQFVHDGNNAADQITVDDTRYYWIRSKKNVGTVAENAVSVYQPNSTTGVGPVTVLATLVDWDNVANPTIGIDINNNDEISINTGVANTTTGQAVATSGIEAGTTVTQGGITMSGGGSIKGGQSAYNSGTGFFLGYDTNAYKFSIGNAGNNSLAFDGTNLAVTGAITATSGTFTGTVNASAGAFTGDVSTDSKFIAGSGATSATMDGGDQNYKFYAGAATAGASPFKVDASGTVTADRIVITRPNDPSAVIFDSAQDGLVGVGLSSFASGSDTAVAQVADELTSNTDYARTILSATQNLTIKTLFPLGYLPFAINSAEDFPDSITLTLQVANITGGVVGTFANVSLGSKTFTRRTLSGAASDDDYYSVYASGTGWYVGGKDAIDSQFNLVMTKTFVATPADRAYRVQVSYVAGSGSSTANPSSSSSRTLYFNSSSQYFTIDSNDIIRDQAAGSLLTGDVILTASSGSRSISWRDSDTQDETFTIEAKPDINEGGSNTMFIKYNNGTTAPFAFVGDGGNFLITGDFYTGSGAITAATASIGGGYGNTGLSIADDGNLSTDGNVIIGGNLTVNGTTTTVNTDNLTVKDNNITLNYSTGDSSSTANNAGITIQDAVNSTTDASILWKTASDTFEFSHPVKDLSLTGNLISDSSIYLRSAGGVAGVYLQDTSGGSTSTAFRLYSDVDSGTVNIDTGGSQTIAAFVDNGNLLITGTIFADGAASNSLQWEAGYDYSQVGHLPLAGGTLTGTLAMGANAITSTGTISSASISTGAISNTGGALNLGHFTIADSDQWPYLTWLRDTANGYDEGLMKGSSSRGVFGRAHFGVHFDSSRSFAFHTTGWDTEMEICGDGRTYIKGPVGIGYTPTSTSDNKLTVDGTISSGAITSSGNITLAEYLYHSGNTGTNLRFLTNRAILTSGGGASVDAHSNSNLYLTGTTIVGYGNYTSTGTISSGAITATSNYSGGSGDYTAITNAPLKIATTSSYFRIPHISANSTISGVYNYETGKNVFWGEAADTGTYYFRGRDLDIQDGVLKIGADTVIDASRVVSPTTVNISASSATTKALTVLSSHSTNAATIVVGNTVTDQTLVDTNARPMVVIDGQYPVLNLNSTVTTNANHGPTIQFTYEGYDSNRQVVIGTDGQGQRLDFGFSGGSSGTNTDKNPHNGIGGYNGITAMRLFPNGLLVGATGTSPNEIASISNALDVRGSAAVSGTISSGAITAPSFTGASFGAATGAPDSTIWAISRDQYPTYGIFYDEGSPDKILYKWNGATKFNINMETGALDTPSTITASGGNSGQWNTAYGWGDHASEPYAKTNTANTFTALQTFSGSADANWKLTASNAIASWSTLEFEATTEWGDASSYGVLGGTVGVMLRRPHVVWSSADDTADIRFGRSGGVSSGSWYGIGTLASNVFSIHKDNKTSPVLTFNGSSTWDFKENNIAVNGVTVIDASRNLTNIGTIATTQVNSTGYVRSTANGLSLWASGSDSYTQVGPNGNGASGVFGAHRETTGSLDYTTYIGYDCYYDDGTNKWYANRTNLGRKWKTNFGGYHQNRFTISTYDGGGTSGSSLSAGWLEADWTERFGVDAQGVVDIGGSLRMGTATVIDSSRNLTNIGTISSGAITSSGYVTASNAKMGVWNANGALSGIFHTSHASQNYGIIFDATNTFVGSGTGGSTHIRYGNNESANQLRVNSSGWSMGSTVVMDGSRNLTNIGTISSGAITSTGAIVSGDNIVIGSGGTYQAGNIYSDSSWGMILRAKQNSPTQADFLFSDYGDNHLVRFDGSYGLRIQTGGLQIGTTQVIDAGRNITAVGGGFSGFLSNTGGAKLEIQNSADGGNSHGIFMWNTSDANWGIYMSTAGSGKSLSGGSASSGLDGRTSHGIRFRVANSSSQIGFLFENAAEQALAQITADSGNFLAKGNVTAYASDQRLKTNIKPIENALEKLNKISGVEYDWVDNIISEYDFHPSAMHETGVIAQQIQAVIPDAVTTAPMNANYTTKSGTDHKFLTVQKDKIVPLLIEAVKEQQKEIEELKSLVKQLLEK